MLLELLLPTTCPVCGRAGVAPCAPCQAELRRAPSLPPPPGLEGCLALLAYEGAGRELVARLKYRNARRVVPWLAAALAHLAQRGRAYPDVVAWAPTSAWRRRERGFDQAELLARAVARQLGVPGRRLLERQPGPAQTGLPLAARRLGPRFRCTAPGSLGRVLLVDDVATSGATLTAAARALRDAGSTGVVGLVAARTPLKPLSRSSDTEEHAGH